MPTNFPSTYDTLVELGGPFLNVSPPVDPFRNIDANRANNWVDSILAIEGRLGKLGEPSSATLDWALLTTAGVPNQGLRITPSGHAVWPGLAAETGIFLDSATGNLCFHKAGDPVGVFQDLTTGGVPTWDLIYAGDQSLTLDTSTFTWTQTAVNTTGFKLTRGLTAAQVGPDDALMLLESISTADSPILTVRHSGAATTPLALFDLGTMNGATGIKIATPYAISATSVALQLYDVVGLADRFQLHTCGRLYATPSNVAVTTGSSAGFYMEIPSSVSASQHFLYFKNTIQTSYPALAVLSGGGVTTQATDSSDGAAAFYGAQNHASGKTLLLKSGLVDAPATDVRLQQWADGHTQIITAVVGVTEPVLYLDQNTNGVALMRFDGNAGAGQIPSISTDTPNAYMLKVQVNGSGASYWIRASDTTMVPFGGVPSWQDIYSTYRTLSLDATGLVWSQVAGSSNELLSLTRGLTAAQTNAPIFSVKNVGATDDQAAVSVSQSGSGYILELIDSATATTRWHFDRDGSARSEANSSMGLWVNQTGVGRAIFATSTGGDVACLSAGPACPIILYLEDGDVGEMRWTFHQDGRTDAYNTGGSYLLNLENENATAPILKMSYNGSPVWETGPEGNTSIWTNNASASLYVEQQTTTSLGLSVSSSGLEHFDVYGAGRVDSYVNSAATALGLVQAGAGPLFSLLSSAANGVQCSNKGGVTVTTDATTATVPLTLDQNHDATEFVDFVGKDAADFTKNISTQTVGMTLRGFVRIHVNGNNTINGDYWVPIYN